MSGRHRQEPKGFSAPYIEVGQKGNGAWRFLREAGGTRLSMDREKELPSLVLGVPKCSGEAESAAQAQRLRRSRAKVPALTHLPWFGTSNSKLIRSLESDLSQARQSTWRLPMILACMKIASA